MSSTNQSFEQDSGVGFKVEAEPSQLISPDKLRWYALHTRARHEK